MEKSSPAPAPGRTRRSTQSVIEELMYWGDYSDELKKSRYFFPEEKRGESEFQILQDKIKACHHTISLLISDMMSRKEPIHVYTEDQNSLVRGLCLDVPIIREYLKNLQDGESRQRESRKVERMDKSAPTRAHSSRSTQSVLEDLIKWSKYGMKLKNRRRVYPKEKRGEEEFKLLEEWIENCDHTISLLKNDIRSRKMVYVDTEEQYYFVCGLCVMVPVVQEYLKNQDGGESSVPIKRTKKEQVHDDVHDVVEINDYGVGAGPRPLKRVCREGSDQWRARVETEFANQIEELKGFIEELRSSNEALKTANDDLKSDLEQMRAEQIEREKKFRAEILELITSG